MLEDVPVEDLLAAIGAVEHDFWEDMGASRVEVIAACDRLIRAAHAMQLEQVNALYEDRMREIGGFRDGDPALHVIGQVSFWIALRYRAPVNLSA